MNNIIIDNGDVFFKAHVQYGFGIDEEAKNRAFVTYISYHCDDMFPYGSRLEELRKKVFEFAFDNNLQIVMEQATDLRFSGSRTNAEIMEDGSVYKDGKFYSPSLKYRSKYPLNDA